LEAQVEETGIVYAPAAEVKAMMRLLVFDAECKGSRLYEALIRIAG